MADESHDCSEIAKVPGSPASTSSSSEGVIINNNSGKQGDVFTHVRGDVFTHVCGDVFTNLRVAGDFILGDKKIQPPTPSRYVVKAKYNGKYLRLTENDGGDFPVGFLKFDGRERELESPRAQFELVKEKSGQEFVHIRCCYNKKYCVRSGATGFIVAAADEPEEDESKISCPLFKLEHVKKSGRVEFQFLHSQRERYACVWRCWNCGPLGIQTHGGLCVGTEANDAYTVVAWESLGFIISTAEKMNKAVEQLPKFVALKGLLKSNEYLSLTTKNDPCLPAGFLQFKGKDFGSPMTKFEIEMAKSESGLVHIRCCDNNMYLVRENTTCTCCNKYYTKICKCCCDNNKYLMREHTTCTCCDKNNRKICDCCCDNQYFIVPAADKPEEDEYKISSTLFMPEPYDESGELKFRFCHVHLGMRRYACMPMVSGVLYGGSNEPHKDACDVFEIVDLDGLG